MITANVTNPFNLRLLLLFYFRIILSLILLKKKLILILTHRIQTKYLFKKRLQLDKTSYLKRLEICRFLGKKD